jgi:hypothetical protein
MLVASQAQNGFVVATVLTIPVLPVQFLHNVVIRHCAFSRNCFGRNHKLIAITTGGTLQLLVGTFNTPILDPTTTYYVDATANGCTTPKSNSNSAT